MKKFDNKKNNKNNKNNKKIIKSPVAATAIKKEEPPKKGTTLAKKTTTEKPVTITSKKEPAPGPLASPPSPPGLPTPPSPPSLIITGATFPFNPPKPSIPFVPPVKNQINIIPIDSPWPYYDETDIKNVSDVLRSGKINQWTGNEVKLFEKEYAEYIGTNYAIALVNGTVALELALYTLNIKEGDEVIVTPRTFIASASSIVLRGAKPIFADIDLESQNITIDTIKKVTTDKTKAVICVHLAGWPCDMDPIIEYAKEHNIYVIEDCAQAHGAMYKGKKVGSIGDISCWSFCQDKIMSTGGEGGMITLNNFEWYKKAWAYKDHGKDYDLVFNNPDKSIGFKWLHTSFGTNWRMTEMQAALGRNLLRKLDNWIILRRRNANIFNDIFSNNPYIKLTIPSEEYYHSYYKYYCFLKDGINKDVIKKLNENGIKCSSGSCSEIYLEKAFKNNYERFHNAMNLNDISLMFMVHPTLSTEYIQYIAKKCNDIIFNIYKTIYINTTINNLVSEKSLSNKKNIINILNNYMYNNINNELLLKNNNEKCIIIGNGPSLNDIDLLKLNDYTTIACNSFYDGLIEKNINFLPTILCAGDYTMSKNILEKNFDIIHKYDPIIILHPSFATKSYSTLLQSNFMQYSNIYNIYNFKKFKLTKSFLSKERVIYNIKNYCRCYSNVIPMISMLIAQKLGFKKIYLIGVDCNNVFDHFYKKSTHTSNQYSSQGYSNIYNGFEKRYSEFKYQNIEVYIHNKNSLLDFIPTFEIEELYK